MSPAHRSLLMRANRHLGAALVEANLVNVSDLEAATERLITHVAGGNFRQASVLGLLAYDLRVLREEDALQHHMEAHGAGLVDLREWEVPEEIKGTLDAGACWATWTLPFDREEGFTSLATAYGMSESVRAFWEKQIGGPILWYGATIEGIAEQLEKLGADRATAAKPSATA
jgi:hypothetical protein